MASLKGERIYWNDWGKLQNWITSEMTRHQKGDVSGKLWRPKYQKLMESLFRSVAWTWINFNYFLTLSHLHWSLGKRVHKVYLVPCPLFGQENTWHLYLQSYQNYKEKESFPKEKSKGFSQKKANGCWTTENDTIKHLSGYFLD